MQADRWRRIEDLYNSALDRDEPARDGYLDVACDGDPQLRFEVVSLLAESVPAEKFLETPALELIRSAEAPFAGAPFDPSGRTISHYEVGEQLGRGGMGVVFKATDVRLGRAVVLKFLWEQLARNPDALQRFQGEARAASALNHRNICTVHDVGEHDGRPFIVMELLEGMTLEQRIGGEPLDESQLIRIALHIADALGAAHAKGIVHRDIKPANVFITADDQVKILDFGLAKLAGTDLDRERSGEISSEVADERVPLLTGNGLAVGTLPYMAPEQWRGATADARSDLYAVGVLMFEMATGERPFRGDGTRQLVDAVLHKPIEHPARRNPQISVALDKVIVRCLAKDPAERYATAGDLREALNELTLRRPGRVKRTLLAAAMTLVVVTALAIATRPLWSRGSPAATAKLRFLAVLPLTNISGGAQRDDFADAMTEQLIAELSSVRSLRVISRNSSMRYKRTTKSVSEIARELNVDGIVRGSVSRLDSRLKVAVNLIDGASGRKQWSETFDCDVHDVSSLQSRVAQAIAIEAGAEVGPEEVKRLTASRPVDPEAFESYLRGHYFLGRWTMTNLQKAIPHFRDAIARDPSMAIAWAGLADAYSLMDHANGRMVMKPEEVYRLATEAANKALALDPDCVDAHTVLGHVLMHEGRYAEAGEHLERAVRLNPNSAFARLWYGTYLLVEGHAEGFAENEKARELDPLSPYINVVSATVAMNGGNMKRASEIALRGIELAPDYERMYVLLADAYMYGGKFREAGQTIDRASRLSEPPPELDDQRMMFLALSGQRAEALSLLEQNLHGARTPNSRRIAFTYAALGETDKAMDWLEKYARDRPYFARLTLDLPRNPAFDVARASARYQALCKWTGRQPHPQMLR